MREEREKGRGQGERRVGGQGEQCMGEEREKGRGAGGSSVWGKRGRRVGGRGSSV